LADARLSEEEIRSLISEGRKAGTIDPGEHNIIENVFEFADLTVGRIMVPRVQMAAFDIEDPARDIARRAIESGYSRLPIYQATLNNIVGILYTKNLLKKLGEDISSLSLQQFLIPPYFVPDSMKITEVLQRLQRKKLHMALVTDEHGEIEGLVTLEDILEEIVGDISDETDEGLAGVVRQPDGSSLVSGELSIVDFNKQFNTQLPEDEDYTTVSGFILNKLGRFPQEGDVVNHEDLEFTVKEKTPRIVKTVVVRKKNNN
jgi:CBS domain containing-hemolysin-like protein